MSKIVLLLLRGWGRCFRETLQDIQKILGQNENYQLSSYWNIQVLLFSLFTLHEQKENCNFKKINFFTWQFIFTALNKPSPKGQLLCPLPNICFLADINCLKYTNGRVGHIVCLFSSDKFIFCEEDQGSYALVLEANQFWDQNVML